MIDKDDPKQMAEALRVAANWIMDDGADTHEELAVIHLMQSEADKLDPPYKLDRSMRK